MILVDFNGLVIGIIANAKEELNDNLIRHIILNQLRQYSLKFKGEYGQMVICCEGRSWRRDYFEQYKHKRKAAREEHKVDWNQVYDTLNMVLDEIRENVPYVVLQHPRCEADDIIGILAARSQEFGKHEDILILSGDHDFKQLQKWKNIKQYSAMQKKFVVEKDPAKYLFEHIVKGDSGDGVPNILSPDNTFVDNIRQSPMTKKRIEGYAADIFTQEERRNFQRNELMVDLSKIPQDIQDEVINMYEATEAAPRSKLLNYLIKKRCKMLIECIGDF